MATARRCCCSFASFPKTAADFEELAKTKLTTPVLSIGGDKSQDEVLGAQAELVASDVKVVVLKSTGDWLMEEAPERVVPILVDFASQ